MSATLFNLPTEIRIMIYKELLVLPEPVIFVADNESDPLLHYFKGYRFYPQLLRVNRRIYSEAISILYSGNLFQFPNIWQDCFSVAYFSPFLDVIGESNTKELRRICFEFPSFHEYHYFAAEGGKEILQSSFELIRDKFRGLDTLEMVSYGTLPPEPSDGSELLGLVNNYLGAAVSPERITVRISNDENPDSHSIKAMRQYGWKIASGKIEEKPEWKEPFYDDWGRPWDEEEYYRHEYKMEQQREKEEWEEEYRRRRADPHWRNDSDYD